MDWIARSLREALKHPCTLDQAGSERSGPGGCTPGTRTLTGARFSEKLRRSAHWDEQRALETDSNAPTESQIVGNTIGKRGDISASLLGRSSGPTLRKSPFAHRANIRGPHDKL